ncbi:hypothetical protein [Nannocystis bainbridge]|uniref:Lipoprotein n=1 Tax=Nannocystis bainbridge TaxID=2995303 RepID=A0ABT5DTZ0_9BACT|nr:hypothetical protein [Nannocystis bainbridge]MDC0717064.1 hypothetical protein [Nannocystis bainbridge]
MRTYLYVLPFTSMLAACSSGGGDCGSSFRCDQLPESATATEGTGTATDDSTGTATEDPTGTGTSTSETGTSEPGTTAETTSETGTTAEPGTTAETSESGTSEGSSTGETTGGPLVEGPASHGESCAPNDGVAVEFKIDLAERACDSDWPEDVPLFRIVLFKSIAELELGPHQLAGEGGFAWYDDGDGTPENTDQGNVLIQEITADGLRGTYEVTLPDNTVLSGAFDSIYCPQDILCG